MRPEIRGYLQDRRFLAGIGAGVVLAVLFGGLAALLGRDDDAVATAAEASPSGDRGNLDQSLPSGSSTPTVLVPSDESSDSSGATGQGGDQSTSPATATIRLTKLPSGNKVTCPEATTTVSDAAGLQVALDSAQPGETIQIADGTYEGGFVTSASGTADKPVYLCGSRAAVLDGGSVTGGYVLHVNGGNYWRLVGFTVRNGQKGVMFDGVAGSVIQELAVSQIGDEAIHLRSGSTGNAVLANNVSRTGLRRDKFGEGVYVGSAVSNWGKYSGGDPDTSDYNLVQGNTISNTGSESVDIKEGTTGGAVIGNTFDGAGMTGGDSWVDVKGSSWLIKDNTGRNTPKDGFQTHHITGNWGSYNTFTGNTAQMSGNGQGYYIHDADSTHNIVRCDNKGGDGTELTSNVSCTN